MKWLPSYKGLRTVRARIFWSVMPIIVVLWVAHGFVDIREHDRLIIGEFMNRGRAMVNNLAQSSELGVYAEDAKLLQAATQGIIGDPDLAYVVIYGENGKVLTQGGRDSQKPGLTSWQFSEAAVASLARGGGPLIAETTGEQGSITEFVAPILSGAPTTVDELLIGSLTPGPSGDEEPLRRVIGVIKFGLSHRSMEKHLAALMRLWVIASAIVCIIATLGIYVFSRRITGPIKDLTVQAARIADGVLDESISVRSRDEIGKLAVTFDRMRRALKHNINEREHLLAQLQDLNRTLAERISERTAELEKRTSELQQTLSEVRALSDISQAVSSSLDVEQVLTTIVTRAAEVSGGDAGVIYEFNENQQVFEVKAMHRLERSLLEALTSTPLHFGEGLIGRAITDNAPVQITNVQGSDNPIPERLRPAMKQSNYRSCLAIPLFLQDTVVGGLVVFRNREGSFSSRVTRLLQTVAGHSVVAICNAQLFREVREKGRELEIASQHKSQFLANMSHELRTPLNAILGYTELISDGIYGTLPEKIQDVMGRLELNGRHLLSLINDVLDLSKIEAGQLRLSLADYSIQEVIHTGLTAVESLGAEKNLLLKVTMPPDLPVGRGDEQRITQAFLNIVGNAMKFTEKGEIHVQVSADNGNFVVAVSDTGPGISESESNRIFEEFQQADSSSTRSKGGTGLGLAIATRMVELHGGRVWVESTLGKGSTFTFSVPIRVDQALEEI